MQQLIYFIRKYKYFLYFSLLQFISILLTINNHNFHRSKFISSSNAITGGIYDKTSELSGYLHLKHQNEILSEENKRLKNKIEKLNSLTDSVSTSTIVDSVKFNHQYNYINGKIIRNQYHKSYNYLTINRGKKHGINKEMAVVNSKGIIGITDNVSNGYARVQSILNRNSSINARFKNNHHFGSLSWDTKNKNIVQLTDIPRQATYKIGDTIITDGKSSIFPEGILIGTVLDSLKNQSASNTVNIRLFNDMSNLGHIYIINNLDKKEIQELEKQENE